MHSVNAASEHSKIDNPIGLVFQNKRMSAGCYFQRASLRACSAGVSLEDCPYNCIVFIDLNAGNFFSLKSYKPIAILAVYNRSYHDLLQFFDKKFRYS
mgnify:CR=1 FL=1